MDYYVNCNWNSGNMMNEKKPVLFFLVPLLGTNPGNTARIQYHYCRGKATSKTVAKFLRKAKS